MLQALAGLSDVLNKLLDGPRASQFRLLYVVLFFGAGAYALVSLSRNLERAESEHLEAVKAMRRAAEQEERSSGHSQEADAKAEAEVAGETRRRPAGSAASPAQD
eukprot:gnl/TRDRNA2_/TRDRNA2_48747_c0_seq1.p1 gnl/TRDRNA2_/TRDRNA2_48747_c0~~gnl/TRDRNA2_/TRDRNA2_48747_c0_seq1.p1  ORF type:complete len:105 (-),score=23.46 gnl/TRDRNA2_/TRDRNA2_48747_c0_seq1:71-385(-)